MTETQDGSRITDGPNWVYFILIQSLISGHGANVRGKSITPNNRCSAGLVGWMASYKTEQKPRNLAGQENRRYSEYSAETRWSVLGSSGCKRHTLTHLSFPFFFSFAPLLAAISVVLFGLLHYANWIGSIPAQIISSCQKDYHIIKGETLLNFNQPGLITMYMQMLNFSSFFSAPSGPWSFSLRWNSLITHLWLWLPPLKTRWLKNQHFSCITHLF